MNNKLYTKKAFTLVETLVAVGALAMVVAFASVIFKVGIDSYRTAGANAEIMLKLRAITDQLNRDFEELRKDGYLILHSEVINRKEYESSVSGQSFRADRVLCFTAGDFQSWFRPDVRSNIARIYLGHDWRSLDDVEDLPVSRWRLVRDAVLITPEGSAIEDCSGISFAAFKANPLYIQDANNLLSSGVVVNIRVDPDSIRSLMCEDIGEIRIDWTTNGLVWWGLDKPIGGTFAEKMGEQRSDTFYWASWIPDTERQYWPRALKFTFTLYDSKGIFKNGRTFTHIVYIGE